ncbi:hypothetical protein Pelo_2966 [Pelomyxa schiedti]|nr:hypothetical protein Pelo_2966 [Pelomyxa schiedti]
MSGAPLCPVPGFGCLIGSHRIQVTWEPWQQKRLFSTLFHPQTLLPSKLLFVLEMICYCTQMLTVSMKWQGRLQSLVCTVRWRWIESPPTRHPDHTDQTSHIAAIGDRTPITVNKPSGSWATQAEMFDAHRGFHAAKKHWEV